MPVSWDNLSDQELELIDGWCDRFEERWRQGDCPVIETIVRSVPVQLQNYLCRELMFLEFDLRQTKGEAPSFAEYFSRFPDLADEVSFRQREMESTQRGGQEEAGADSASLAVDRSVIPRQILQYQILDTMGRCDVGPILRAMDSKRRRVVSVTVLDSELAANIDARRAFISAGRSVAAITDPHVAAVFETFEEDAAVCHFQEYVVGLALDAHIEQGMTPSATEIARIGWQAASGLAAAHQQGVIHGRLTTSSLILENGLPRIKIVGFGHSRVLELSRTSFDASERNDLDGDGKNLRPSQTSDLFDLGCILYKLCTGNSPDGPPTLADSKLPDWLTSTICKLMSEDPQERFASAAAVAFRLSEGLAKPSRPEKRESHARIDIPTVPPTERKPVSLSVIWIGACLAIGLITWFTWSTLR